MPNPDVRGLVLLQDEYIKLLRKQTLRTRKRIAEKNLRTQAKVRGNNNQKGVTNGSRCE
jgi:hypothetical protein